MSLIYSFMEIEQGYRVRGDTDKTVTSITIPAKYKGYPVIEIAINAFDNYEYLESVVIEKGGLKAIRSAAFKNSSLKNIEIPYGVECIERDAFSICLLEEIIIPNSVVKMGANVFFETDVKIYCEATEKPDEWDKDWAKEDSLGTKKVYWYRETAPADTGIYWHYITQDGFKISAREEDEKMIDSRYFKVSKDGKVVASNFLLQGTNINTLTSGISLKDDIEEYVSFWAGGAPNFDPADMSETNLSSLPFYVTNEGALVASRIDINGGKISSLEVGNVVFSSSGGNATIEINPSSFSNLTLQAKNTSLSLGNSKESFKRKFYVTNYSYYSGGGMVSSPQISVTLNIENGIKGETYPFYLVVSKFQKNSSLAETEEFISVSRDCLFTNDDLTTQEFKFVFFVTAVTQQNKYEYFVGVSFFSLENARNRAITKEGGYGVGWTGSISYDYYNLGKFVNYEDIPVTSSSIIIKGNLVPNENGSVNTNHLGSTDRRWGVGWFRTVYNDNGIIGNSDFNKKNSINKLSDNYSQVFDNLYPVTFKYNNGESGRTHAGFIAQEVRDATLKAGLTTQDFAAYCEWEEGEGDDKHVTCGLRYEEFIALCVDQIQKLKAKVNELEANIKEIKGETENDKSKEINNS